MLSQLGNAPVVSVEVYRKASLLPYHNVVNCVDANISLRRARQCKRQRHIAIEHPSQELSSHYVMAGPHYDLTICTSVQHMTVISPIFLLYLTFSAIYLVPWHPWLPSSSSTASPISTQIRYVTHLHYHWEFQSQFNTNDPYFPGY